MPAHEKLRTQAFILDQMRHSMKFFSPERAIDKTGGYFHFFAEDGSIFDADTKVLVTQARFIFSLSVMTEHLKDPKSKGRRARRVLASKRTAAEH